MFPLFRRISRPQSQNNIETTAGQKLPPQRQSLSGYESALLVDVVFTKTKALRREDVPFYTGTERTMLSALLAARVTRSEPLRVLDFGGACGFHHMAAEIMGLPMRWAVVESPAMASKAHALSTETLRFFEDTDAAAIWTNGVDLMFSSGALQYVDDPDIALRRLVALRAPLMVWARLSMTDGEARREMQSSRLADNGPGPLPPEFEDMEVFYPKTILSEHEFIKAHEGYKVVFRSGDVSSAEFIFLRDDFSPTDRQLDP